MTGTRHACDGPGKQCALDGCHREVPATRTYCCDAHARQAKANRVALRRNDHPPATAAGAPHDPARGAAPGPDLPAPQPDPPAPRRHAPDDERPPRRAFLLAEEGLHLDPEQVTELRVALNDLLAAGERLRKQADKIARALQGNTGTQNLVTSARDTGARAWRVARLLRDHLGESDYADPPTRRPGP